MYNSEVTTINAGHKIIDLTNPLIMGIINLTPDSFYDGGAYTNLEKALQRAGKLIEQGADILDIGAYSSRPNAAYVEEQEEMDRLLPFIALLKREYPTCIISVDSFRARVAEAAILSGAHIVNDISGGSLDDKMYETVGGLQVPYILMHMRGKPENMQTLTDYEDIVGDLCTYFADRIAKLRTFGVKDIILDPGPGFAKTITQNFEMIDRFSEFKVFGLPLLGAVSRKSMIYKTLSIDAKDALNGTTVLNTILLLNGANILRVHDVNEAKEVVLLIKKLKRHLMKAL